VVMNLSKKQAAPTKRAQYAAGCNLEDHFKVNLKADAGLTDEQIAQVKIIAVNDADIDDEAAVWDLEIEGPADIIDLINDATGADVGDEG
jgi:hypothetical protein